MTETVNDLPTTNEEKLKCKFCNSQILSEKIGKMIYDRTIDIPLMMQKKDYTEIEKEDIKKFCIVEKVFDFDNVGVTRSHEGRVYLTCSECDMGPIGLKDPDSTQYLVAIERVVSSSAS
jgi:hypothetical protein